MYIFGAGSSIIWCLRFGDKQKGAISYGKHTNVGHKDEGWRAKDEIRCLIRTKDDIRGRIRNVFGHTLDYLSKLKKLLLLLLDVSFCRLENANGLPSWTQHLDLAVNVCLWNVLYNLHCPWLSIKLHRTVTMLVEDWSREVKECREVNNSIIPHHVQITKNTLYAL